MNVIPYVERFIDGEIVALMSELPALLLTGPRGSGKTTTAERHVRTVVRLDGGPEAAAFAADPDFALGEQETPVLLDEWQAVPQVLGAVKRAVDREHRPGRFILTGGVRARLTSPTWPGTGRVIPLRMFGLTEREVVGRVSGPTFLERLVGSDVGAFSAAPGAPNLGNYVDLAIRGGFPIAALTLSEDARARWLDGYVDQLVTRDVDLLSQVRDPARLRRYLEALALSTAGIVDEKTLYDAAGINRRTAKDYDRLLTNLFIVENLPAWSTNRLTRLSKRAKRYLVDPSLVTAILKMDRRDVVRNGDLLGRIIDTFVVSQIRPELEIGNLRPRLYHLRHRDLGREIDVIAEFGARGLIGLEIKATATPDRSDARHLIWLRNQLGDQFLAGAVLHTGPLPFRLDGNILALPIYTLWN